MSKIKKVFLLFLFVFFLFQIFSVISINNSVFAESIIYGDINGDGEVNSIDYAILKKYLLGKIKEFDKPNAIKAADVDGNEEINSIDFAFMKKYLLGLIKVFPAYEKSTPTPLITATPTPTNSTPSEFAKLKPSITDVRMSELNRNSIELLWDQVEGAVLYEVLRDDVSIGTTSDTYFADLNVSEGMNHIYKIRAVNDLGESSQDSSNILVNTMDEVIDSNTVLSEDRYYINLSLEGGATLDLNGYALNVKGDFIQNRGNVNVNSGDLKVNGDYTIYEDGQLVMMNEGDYVGVGGDFIISNYDIKHSEGCLSEGVLEIKGDFVFESMLGYFSAGGNHKVVLSGDKEQTVKSNNGLGFNELEIRNEYGVKIETPIGINKMKGNYRVIGGMTLNYVGIVEGDVIVEGDLRLECPMLDLCGNRMVVLGSIIQGYEGPMVHVRINGGSIEVDGDYSMGPSAILEMTNEGDYVGVGGDFIISNYDIKHSEGCLSEGVLEIKGDFVFESMLGYFSAGGNHKVVLSGDKEQAVKSNNGLGFNELEIRNEYGVKIETPIGINKMKGNYRVIGGMNLNYVGIVEGDVIVEGDLRLECPMLDLCGNRMVVLGSIIQGYEGPMVHVRINGGSIEVDGDYSMGPSAILEMMNEGDYVGVGGDFIISNYDIKHSEGCLSEGVLEIKGDFVFESMLGYFSAGGNHKVVLSGDKEQTVKSNNGLGFNELEIRNEYGVKIETPIGINKMKGNYRVIGGMNLNYVGIVEGDVIVEGDLRLECPMLDLCGNRMVVLGNIIQGYEGPIVHVRINGGSIEVDGDYSMGPNAILEMMNEGDYVGVGGDFIISNYDIKHSEGCLSEGVLEIKGDLVFENMLGYFSAGGNHKVVLSGDKEQAVKSNNGLGFNELEIRNEYGVKIETPIGINKMKGNYRVIGGMNLNYVGIVEGDVIVEGDLRLECPMLDLCGNRMVVLGNIIQGYEGPIVHVRINGGSIEVDGDYSMGPSAILEMMNEGDYVGVGGNFTMASNVDHSEYLTAGNLEVKGDFTQSNGPSNFAASGTHRTILSGDSVQTITFEYPGTSSFNILKLTKPINTGYIFNTSPVWKSLEE